MVGNTFIGSRRAPINLIVFSTTPLIRIEVLYFMLNIFLADLGKIQSFFTALTCKETNLPAKNFGKKKAK